MLNSKQTYQAEVIGFDKNTDIALLKIDAKQLPFLTYGNSNAVKIGEWVLAVGKPFNLNSTVTSGIISAKGRNINILDESVQDRIAPIESFIQTDAMVNPGNSGGALVNTKGDLIGVNTAIASNNGTYQGYSFDIPVNIVKKIVSDLIDFGSVQRAFISLSIQDIDADLAKKTNTSQLQGVYVNGIVKNGAGEDAKIQVGDVITKIENITINSKAELLEQLSKYRPNDKISIQIVRNKKMEQISLVLKNKDNGLVMVKNMPSKKTVLQELGAELEEVNNETLNKLYINSGVQVTKLINRKLAYIGIKEGFIITSINNYQITSVEDIKKIMKHSQHQLIIEGVYPNDTRAYYGMGV